MEKKTTRYVSRFTHDRRQSLGLLTEGSALIISMIFVLIFSALAVSMATISGTNLQIAENQRKANRARACGESGLEIVRLWLNQVSIPGITAEELQFSQIADSFQSAANGISNITPYYDSLSITVPSVTLNSAEWQSFSAVIIPHPLDPETLQVDVTGVHGPVTKTISVNYKFGTREHTVFDYGIATKGPLSLAGNIELTGENKISVDASVYIESDDLIVLSITGNSQIAGDVHISNPLATVDLQGGQASIGGETVPEAYDHVINSMDEVEFPVPNPEYFAHYVVNDINYPSGETTFENIRIPPYTNPIFSSDVTLKGVVFIETPNVVTFNGHVNITGIIVGNGDITDDSGTNQIDFQGTVNSNPVTDLPEEFGDLRNETGTFLLAPGFRASFSGTFSTLSGAIAANGIEFSGNAGGTINGSIINYSDEEMILSGNSDLNFNRSGTVEIPAGFVPEIVLHYDPLSYSEIIL